MQLKHQMSVFGSEVNIFEWNIQIKMYEKSHGDSRKLEKTISYRKL